MGMIRIKRIYEPAAPTDGERVLVDRIWPRGVSKDAAKLDFWLKEIAPTTSLRKWFGHDPSRFDEFRERYCDELGSNTDAVSELRRIAARGDVTLLYAAHDEHVNHAVVLADYIKRHRHAT